MYQSAYVDTAKCNGCKVCVQFCPDPNAINFVRETKKAIVIPSRCKGCGICAMKCSRDAIEMKMIVVNITNPTKDPTFQYAIG